MNGGVCAIPGLHTFMGEDKLLRSRGVPVHVLQDATCVELTRSHTAAKPGLWNEDNGADGEGRLQTAS